MKSTSSSIRRFGVWLFLLIAILLASWEGAVPMAEARVCESQSHGFHSTCTSDHNCGLVCHNEGFSGGKCRGLRRRCFCTRVC